ncbi:MAG: MFS transporter [Anaerolineae bacterium]|jgi:predicted MFS family arabinose efflux permease
MRSRYRWFVVFVFFVFMLLHQSDKLLIGSLTTPIMDSFGINEEEMGRVFTGALIVAAVLYPLWGYLCDRFARPKLLAAASLIWGSTTWLSAIAPTYPAFLATRASTGIDDSSYPGLYSLIADYFGPRTRGRIYGLLQLTMPLGYMMGMVLALQLGAAIGWRKVFYITGSAGVLLAILIFAAVRGAPRGSSEPELAGLEQISIYRFDWQLARGLFRKPSLCVLFAQGFFGVFPWEVITYWFIRYLEAERGYTANAVMITMGAAVLVLAGGYFVGGSAGDFLFKRTQRGRLIVSTVAVLVGALLLPLTLSVPNENQTLFLAMLSVNALVIPFAAPNVISTVYDVALPEVRSTAMAIHHFIESAGAALAPWLAGLIAVRSSLHDAILLICVAAWVLCAILLAFAAYLVPRDIQTLRSQLRRRARLEQAMDS